MATVSEVKSLLADTTIPEEMIDDSLDAVSALWLMSAPAELLASDLVLCHPPIGPSEVRAVAHPLGAGWTRLTVVAHDRPGLLADTAAVLAAERLPVGSASALSWAESGLALHALMVPDADMTAARWDELGARLRRVGAGEHPSVTFTPRGRPEIHASPSGMGRSVVTVTAPDQVGLLWAICQWFADQGVSIEAAHVGTEGGQACDHFIVVGHPDAAALAARLTGRSHPVFDPVIRAAATAAGTGARLADGLARRLRGR